MDSPGGFRGTARRADDPTRRSEPVMPRRTSTTPSRSRTAARAEIDALLASGDLFRYRAARLAGGAARGGVRGVHGGALRAGGELLLFGAVPGDEGAGPAPGGRVLIPAFTFAAVPSAVVHAGGVPVLVEVGDNFRIDLDGFRG